MELYNDDCYNVLPKLKEIDCIIVDLPYGITACSWDMVIDLEEMWKQIKKIIKPNANIIFFCTTKFGYELIKSNPKWFRYDIVWEKPNSVGFLNSNKSPLRCHEMIYVFNNPSKSYSTYNPQKIEGQPFYHKNNKSHAELYGDIKRIPTENQGTRFPRSIQKFTNSHKGSFHPTQKPTDLLEWLLKSYSNENDVVLDFTMGSGSTGVACKNTNRKFIGIEKDEEIFKVAKQRLQ